MMLSLIDKIGDWNPQLLRELKGRLKPFPVLIAVGASLLLQLVIFLYQLSSIPGENYSITDSYCRLSQGYQNQQTQLYNQQKFLEQQLSNYQSQKPSNLALISDVNRQLEQTKTQINELEEYLQTHYCPSDQINMSLWWRDHWEYIFLSLTVCFIFTLLVAGTYLLINDLAKEENRGTLNFIRLSPQPEASILTGKLLGVPIVIYLVILVALPLHFWAGISAKIASSYILSFYAVLAASCIFFYSAALLFGLASRWFSGFQPWLGSGAVLIFLFVTMLMASNSHISLNAPISSLRLFSPWDVTNYLFLNLFDVYQVSELKNLEFFSWPIGKNVAVIIGLHLFNYGLWTYWIWQGMKRCFRNPNATILNKRQSYLFVACFQVMFLGFTIQTINKEEAVFNNLFFLSFLNSLLILSLIAILSPHRQTIQDWARYKHQNNRHNSLWQDLMFGEKSPAIVAIAINLVITTTPLVLWTILAPNTHNFTNLNKIQVILAMALFISLMMIYATIAQLMLLMKNSKRAFWAIGTVAAAMFLPALILQLLDIHPSKHATVWLFSTFPWEAIQYSATTTIFMALLADFTVLALLNFQLTRQIKLAGESATKALLAEAK
ncbi:MAG: ABC transporter permease subunit [Gloeotrichia echinulata GP01]